MTGVTIRRIGGLSQANARHSPGMLTYQIEVGGEIYGQVARWASDYGRKTIGADIRYLVRYAMRWRRSVHGPLHLVPARGVTR